jgi:hypothetical protein
MMTPSIFFAITLAVYHCSSRMSEAFTMMNKHITTTKLINRPPIATLYMSSFSSDGSDYTSKASDYDNDDYEMNDYASYRRFDDGIREDDIPTQELQPVPMSKNTGNRFVALYWDHELQALNKSDTRSVWDLHDDHNDVNEDHVMFCRKKNLYNETFNADSMVDILRSLPM